METETAAPTGRTCVNCDGPHAYRDCPDLPVIDTAPKRCDSCKRPVNPETAECSGCSE